MRHLIDLHQLCRDHAEKIIAQVGRNQVADALDNDEAAFVRQYAPNWAALFNLPQNSSTWQAVIDRLNDAFVETLWDLMP
ncbi:hypothetical protein [Conchiformibius steedae]|uniref:hypothetical protein n=1 Tax=Conchiformibius steedae TaxID=153493 RepID=UPI0026EB8129|nr:hypothetical protein [Conchiformibius steedae]